MPPFATDDASSRHRSRIRRVLRALGATGLSVIVSYLGLCVGALCAYRLFFPPVTGVQLQREIEGWTSEQAHSRTYLPVSLDRLPRALPLAVIAGEDTRFFEHRGLDWTAIQEALEEKLRRDRVRGASTITQQLVKNLFLTTHRSYLRKGLEVPLALVAEVLLSKQRILELYVNVIEWGPATYGVEAAARYHYGMAAARLSRRQAAALAACIPNPLHRTPHTVGRYQHVILYRMKVLEELSVHEHLPAHAESPGITPDAPFRTERRPVLRPLSTGQ